MTKAEARDRIMDELGSAFIEGKSIDLKKGIARIIVRKEGGIEEEIVYSIPSINTKTGYADIHRHFS